MSKMGQYFLQLQEQGKVPWEPIGDNDDVQDREECKVSWQIKQPVEGHSLVGHGNKRQCISANPEKSKGISFVGELHQSVQSEQSTETILNEDVPPGGCADFSIGGF